MTYRGPVTRFVLLLLVYMLLVAAGVALWFLERPEPRMEPRRTRPPVEAP